MVHYCGQFGFPKEKIVAFIIKSGIPVGQLKLTVFIIEIRTLYCNCYFGEHCCIVI